MAKKILIVDDSESIREVISFTLENAGYEINKAMDGKDALKFLDGRKYDLVILSHVLEHMSAPHQFLENIWRLS